MIILDKNIKIICITKKYCYLNFMRSNPPFDPRIQTIGINQNGPSTIHMPQMMINQMPPQQNFIQRPPIPQPMPNYIMQSPSPYPQHPIPTQFSN
jgi:hypothetical protein